MYPGHWSVASPDRPALVVAGSGQVVTHRELDERSNRLAHWMFESGVRPGDHVAVVLPNDPRLFEVVWAALRSGLYVTTVNYHLTADEAAYIVGDCTASVLITSADLLPMAEDLRRQLGHGVCCLMMDGSTRGYENYDTAVAEMPTTAIGDELLGEFMSYSSGTTGRPKGISRPLSGRTAERGPAITRLLQRLFGFDDKTVYLSPAPLYHAGPLGFTVATQALGGTVVMMPRFDAESALAAIERYAVTHSQWVPTMFSRMLKLPDQARKRHDLSSHHTAIHAAAPCPLAVKQAMLEWWGPILHEYYAGSEGNGFTYASPTDWLSHPGTVGKAVFGVLHICDDEGNEVPIGEEGVVYFEEPKSPFEYHGDKESTDESRNRQHDTWTTLGDVGRLDDDGFLYLTDRTTFMIVSAGVNIYPREIEDCLIVHPEVEDVAVFGIPNDEMGEEVKAVVQLIAGVEAGPETEARLLAYVRERLSHFKCPRSIDFSEQLPRLESGKLYKRELRDPFWSGRTTRIV